MSELLVTPQEAVKLSWNYEPFDELNVIRELFSEYVKSHADKKDALGDEVYVFCLLQAVWHAGRIQGKREERKRRAIAKERRASV